MPTRIAFVAPSMIALALVLSSAALADEAPSAPPRVRPPSTVLRHVDAQTLEVPPTARPDTHAKEVVVLVGGYQSCSCIPDGAFDPLRDRLIAAGYDVVRFGQDPNYPYDTLGHIDTSAVALRDEVRHLGAEYAGVHIVSHSMGGVVADQAFVDGLSAADGVLTYVAWSAPHSGSQAAAALGVVRFAHGDEGLLREVAHHTGQEPDSIAARELISVHAPVPPAGVVRLDIREADDVLVTKSDARDPGVESRTLEGNVAFPRGLDGHGAILVDPQAIDLTVRTIATRRVPPDDRARKLVDAAESDSRRWSALALALLIGFAAASCLRLVDRSWLAAAVPLAFRLFPRWFPPRGRCE